MKKTLVLTFLLGLVSTPLWAKPPHAGSASEVHSKAQAKADQMAEFLGLDDQQQALFDAVLDAKMDARTLKHEGRQLKRTLMTGYASGQLSKREVRRRVGEAQQNALNTHQNAFNAHMDFVASLNEEQRSKLIQKMDHRLEKSEKHQSEKMGPKGQSRLDRMSEHLSLDADQQVLLEQLKIAAEDLHSIRMEAHQSRKEVFPLLLKGEVTEAELQIELESHHAEVVKAQSSTVEAMFELVDSLSDAQKSMLRTKHRGENNRPQRSGRPSPQR